MKTEPWCEREDIQHKPSFADRWDEELRCWYVSVQCTCGFIARWDGPPEIAVDALKGHEDECLWCGDAKDEPGSLFCSHECYLSHGGQL